MRKIKIAFCMAALDGGVGKVILNYFDQMPIEDYNVDIITQDFVSKQYIEEYKDRNFKILKVPTKKESLFGNMKTLYKIMKREKYDIVHSHMTLTNFFPLFIAKICGVKIRISHSHLAGKHSIKSKILATLSNLVATDYFACGKDAGKFLFGKRKFKVINNAIDLDRYRYSKKIRDEQRKKLKIAENEILIGHVGRFTEQKNHEFILDVFKQVHSSNKNTKLLLMGDGKLKKNIIEKSRKMDIYDSVIYTGAINDVAEKLQAIDLFILPSLFEGLCIAAIEAQANGLPCLFSNNVSRETAINDNIRFCDLNNSLMKWNDEIEQLLEIGRVSNDKLEQNGFDIRKEASSLDSFYKDKLKENNIRC